MTEIISIARDLSGVGFGTLLIVILFGSYKGYWVWGRQLTEMRVDYDKRLTKYEEIATKWQDIAIKATGLAEHGVAIAKQRISDGAAS